MGDYCSHCEKKVTWYYDNTNYKEITLSEYGLILILAWCEHCLNWFILEDHIVGE